MIHNRIKYVVYNIHIYSTQFYVYIIYMFVWDLLSVTGCINNCLASKSIRDEFRSKIFLKKNST